MATTEHLDAGDQRDFRLKAREWMTERLPPRVPDEAPMDWENKALVARDREIQRMLWDGGLAGVTVPKAYGGLGLDQRYEDILWEEAEPYRLPWHFGNAFVVVLPTMLRHASEYLKTRYIPAMLKGEHIWCQLLSEPSGGSDLAGLLTKAEKRGNNWVLNGSKVWTTGGSDSDYGICLARTDPTVPKHAGLTMFVVDLHAPGVTVKPLKLLSGGSDFCQEFLDDVEVPGDHVVGEVNGGWAVATSHLAHEREGMARGWHIGLRPAAEAPHLQLSEAYADLARSLGVSSEAHARQLIGQAYVLDAVATLTMRRISAGIRTGALAPTAGAISSLMTARSDIRRTALLSELAGPVGVAAPAGGAGPELGLQRVSTHRIGGGTLEMQLNGVAERHLGLPRESSFDRELPFNQLKHNKVVRPGS